MTHGGRIEVLHKGIWGTINGNFSTNEGRVVCRELGYHDVKKVLKVDVEIQELCNIVIWIMLVECNGSEENLRHCFNTKTSQEILNNYNSKPGVGVLCKMSKSRAQKYYNKIKTFLLVHLLSCVVVCVTSWC